MRNFLRLPPLVRVAWIGMLLFPLAGIVLLLASAVLHLAGRGSLPIVLVAQNLLVLSQACLFVVATYGKRVRRPRWWRSPLESWQSQVRAIVLLSAMPLGGIALALVVPQTPGTFGVLVALLVLSSAVLLAAYLATALGDSEPMRTPPTG
jgi:hypothetical protein